MDKKRIISLVVAFAVIAIIVSIYFFLFHPNFKEVYSTESKDTIKENTPYWICVKGPEYEGFFNVSYLYKNP